MPKHHEAWDRLLEGKEWGQCILPADANTESNRLKVCMTCSNARWTDSSEDSSHPTPKSSGVISLLRSPVTCTQPRQQSYELQAFKTSSAAASLPHCLSDQQIVASSVHSLKSKIDLTPYHSTYGRAEKTNKRWMNAWQHSLPRPIRKKGICHSGIYSHYGCYDCYD